MLLLFFRWPLDIFGLHLHCLHFMGVQPIHPRRLCNFLEGLVLCNFLLFCRHNISSLCVACHQEIIAKRISIPPFTIHVYFAKVFAPVLGFVFGYAWQFHVEAKAYIASH